MTVQVRTATTSGARPVTSRSGFAGPNFFIVGAPKCGTTAWATYLADHPDIFVPKAKEPHFFNTDQPGFRWSQDLQAYFDHYRDHAGEKVVLDASVQYLYSTEAARNIARFDPEARILIMLRRPSAFIRSYHNQLLMNLDENIEDLRAVWEASGQRSAADIPAGNREASLLDYKRAGRFSEQAARYLKVFDRSQIMVVFMEDWTKDPRTLYLCLMGFLGLEDDRRTDFPQVHAAKHVSSPALHRLTQRPSGLLKTAARLFRRLPGMGHVRPVNLLRRMNSRTGYGSASIDAELAWTIDDYFTQDQDRLRKLLEFRA